MNYLYILLIAYFIIGIILAYISYVFSDVEYDLVYNPLAIILYWPLLLILFLNWSLTESKKDNDCGC